MPLVFCYDVTPQIFDLYQPLPNIEGVAEEENPLTVRAIVVGVILGSLVNASNIYLGLKTGFLFGASMFGAIFGFGIVKLLTKVFPGVPFLGSPFGPKENAIIQATSAGAGGLGGLFTAGLPAMYQLDLLSENPANDFSKIITLTLVCSFFGLCFAIPLRKFFIVNMARELRLVFPTPTATAVTIQAMHAAHSEGVQAMRRIKALSFTFLGAFVQRVVSYYAIGILYDWHIFTWFFIWGNYNNAAIYVENWGWLIEWTPAFIGSGMLVGMNTAVSMFCGTLFAWGILGPILVHHGICIGTALAPESERWHEAVTFTSLNGVDENGYVPSPRYWFLWPGVTVLVCCSVAELLVHWRIFYYGIKYAWKNTSINVMRKRGGRSKTYLPRNASPRPATMFNENIFKTEDPAEPKDQVPNWIWASGALAMVVVACIISEVQFNVNAGLAIVASILAVFFAFLGIHGAGVTDIAPLTASANAAQLVFGGITSGQGLTIPQAQTVNLVAGSIASGAAEMAQELTSDFRTGFLLRTPPKKQFYAQVIGAIFAMFIAPGVFVLFTSAYPCIIHPDEYPGTCTFSAPSVTAWRAIAQAVTGDLDIPVSSGIFSCVLGAIAIIQVVLKHIFLNDKREKYRSYLPNWMAVGVAFVLPQTYYSTATLMGAVISYTWMNRRRASYDTYCYAMAAGLIAGEGLGGVIGAALQLGGVGGDVYGTQAGCPLDLCS
ncbi:OPT oligopeptide transporter protein-domain-containing protein [Truncatella angustata]|uniref:OPT oligopeptide transporter protein-domain-containing protein n=1 Tax=Truncatella angustata TaxID=152316 RepID=A0A9P8UNH3_9PEZI|nr:OPT oligopeptide transporter protein-domain-containing protein [Truncatella angustata]KAH6655211.1 OPT oligopeptide transporter protein-domain-containing protein [Truncatella angustata]